jgi:membrane associated rhomboid family serine protease
MTSNINDFDNLNNNAENTVSSIKNQFLNFISTIPFCVKSLLIINLIFYLFSFSTIFSYYLSNIPKYTILSFQIWRLITANLLSTGFMNILCLFFFGYLKQ